MLGVYTVRHHRRLPGELDLVTLTWTRGLLVAIADRFRTTNSTSRTRSGAALVKNILEIEAALVIVIVLGIGTAVIFGNLVNLTSVMDLVTVMLQTPPYPPRPART